MQISQILYVSRISDISKHRIIIHSLFFVSIVLSPFLYAEDLCRRGDYLIVSDTNNKALSMLITENKKLKLGIQNYSIDKSFISNSWRIRTIYGKSYISSFFKDNVVVSYSNGKLGLEAKSKNINNAYFDLEYLNGSINIKSTTGLNLITSRDGELSLSRNIKGSWKVLDHSTGKDCTKFIVQKLEDNKKFNKCNYISISSVGCNIGLSMSASTNEYQLALAHYVRTNYFMWFLTPYVSYDDHITYKLFNRSFIGTMISTNAIVYDGNLVVLRKPDMVMLSSWDIYYDRDNNKISLGNIDFKANKYYIGNNSGVDSSLFITRSNKCTQYSFLSAIDESDCTRDIEYKLINYASTKLENSNMYLSIHASLYYMNPDDNFLTSNFIEETKEAPASSNFIVTNQILKNGCNDCRLMLSSGYCASLDSSKRLVYKMCDEDDAHNWNIYIAKSAINPTMKALNICTNVDGEELCLSKSISDKVELSPRFYKDGSTNDSAILYIKSKSYNDHAVLTMNGHCLGIKSKLPPKDADGVYTFSCNDTAYNNKLLYRQLWDHSYVFFFDNEDDAKQLCIEEGPTLKLRTCDIYNPKQKWLLDDTGHLKNYKSNLYVSMKEGLNSESIMSDYADKRNDGVYILKIPDIKNINISDIKVLFRIKNYYHKELCASSVYNAYWSNYDITLDKCEMGSDETKLSIQSFDIRRFENKIHFTYKNKDTVLSLGYAHILTSPITAESDGNHYFNMSYRDSEGRIVMHNFAGYTMIMGAADSQCVSKGLTPCSLRGAMYAQEKNVYAKWDYVPVLFYKAKPLHKK